MSKKFESQGISGKNYIHKYNVDVRKKHLVKQSKNKNNIYKILAGVIAIGAVVGLLAYVIQTFSE
jgi:hypothetical protein